MIEKIFPSFSKTFRSLKELILPDLVSGTDFLLFLSIPLLLAGYFNHLTNGLDAPITRDATIDSFFYGLSSMILALFVAYRRKASWRKSPLLMAIGVLAILLVFLSLKIYSGCPSSAHYCFN